MNQEIKFYCPVKGCLFSEEKGKHFKRKMLLEQHFLNCHSERKHKCNKCGKSYAIDWQLKYHSQTCGLIWKCLTCDKSYKERLSLITHCKRHLHTLPLEAKRRKSKTNLTPFASFNVILLPVISNISQAQLKPIVKSNQKKILPKTEKIFFLSSEKFKNTSIPPEISCQSSETLKELEVNLALKIKKAQRATQTEKITKGSASRSAQCPPVKSKNVKKYIKINLESTETQTFESILFESNSLMTLTKATSTCFSCNPEVFKSSETNDDLISNMYMSELNQSNLFSSPFIKPYNPLLCQFNSSIENPIKTNLNSEKHKTSTAQNDNLLFEQSVQTDETANYLFNPLNDIETQTSGEFLNDIDFTNFDPLNSKESEFFFTELESNDIETQTIWSKSQTTQTDNSQHNNKNYHFF